VQPEPVETSLLDDHHLDRLADPPFGFLPKPGEQVEQRAPVTGGYGALGDLLLARRVGCHEPGLAAEFQRRKQGAVVGSGGGRSR